MPAMSLLGNHSLNHSLRTHCSAAACLHSLHLEAAPCTGSPSMHVQEMGHDFGLVQGHSVRFPVAGHQEKWRARAAPAAGWL